MGFFDKFSHKGKKNKEDDSIHSYHRLADLLGLDAGSQRCIDEPEAYYEEHAKRYDERSLSADTDVDTIIWIGIVDELIEREIAFEFDYKVELEDFLWGMNRILPNAGLSVDKGGLNAEEDITSWTKELNDRWKVSGFAIAAMDIDSDSYVVFVCDAGKYDTLVAEAEKIGHRIAYANEM